MLELNRAHLGDVVAARVASSALALPLRDRAVACAVSIRLTHHLDRRDEVERLLHELTRVSRDWVVVTYFSHYSLKNWLRRLRSALFGRRPKNTVKPADLRALAQGCGFDLVAAPPLSRLFSGHRFAVLRRVEA